MPSVDWLMLAGRATFGEDARRRTTISLEQAGNVRWIIETVPGAIPALAVAFAIRFTPGELARAPGNATHITVSIMADASDAPGTVLFSTPLHTPPKGNFPFDMDNVLPLGFNFQNVTFASQGMYWLVLSLDDVEAKRVQFAVEAMP